MTTARTYEGHGQREHWPYFMPGGQAEDSPGRNRGRRRRGAKQQHFSLHSPYVVRTHYRLAMVCLHTSRTRYLVPRSANSPPLRTAFAHIPGLQAPGTSHLSSTSTLRYRRRGETLPRNNLSFIHLYAAAQAAGIRITTPRHARRCGRLGMTHHRACSTCG